MSLTIEERNAIIDYRLEKAYSTYTEAEKVLSLDIYNLAANRLYYAVYYAATALLLHHGQSSHTHRGAMTLFHLHFVKTGILPAEDGALFRQLFGMRHEGDYEDFIDLSREDIEPFVELSKVFIDKINAMLNRVHEGMFSSCPLHRITSSAGSPQGLALFLSPPFSLLIIWRNK